MRAVFGIIALLLVLLIVGTLVKKQMAVETLPVPACTPEISPSCLKSDYPQKPAAQKEQAQQIQQQVKEALDAAQKARPPTDEVTK